MGRIGLKLTEKRVLNGFVSRITRNYFNKFLFSLRINFWIFDGFKCGSNSFQIHLLIHCDMIIGAKIKYGFQIWGYALPVKICIRNERSAIKKKQPLISLIFSKFLRRCSIVMTSYLYGMEMLNFSSTIEVWGHLLATTSQKCVEFQWKLRAVSF